MGEPVRARRAAIAAGVCVALYLFAVMWVRAVPDWAVGLFGGPTGLARYGGLQLLYRPPPGADPYALADRIAQQSRARATVVGGEIAVDLYGVALGESRSVLRTFTQGGVEFRVVREDQTLGSWVDKKLAPTAAGVDIDAWHANDKPAYQTYYVRAPTRDALEAKVAALKAAGWQPAPDAMIAYGEVSGSPDRPAYWRTYTLDRAVALDASAIADARFSSDPTTGQPLIQLDFTRDGGRAFGDLTERIVGHKLATVLAGDVVSAPVIETAIRGGRAVVSMGGGDAEKAQRDAATMLDALRAGYLPRGGEVVASNLTPPGDATRAELLGRCLIALVCGAIAGVLVALLVRVLRPARPEPFAAAGALPWRRVLVTLLAPVALYAATKLPLPFLDAEEVDHLLSRGASYPVALTVFELGLAPVFTAFTLVELVALLAPSLRRKRFDPRWRAQSGRVVALLVVALSVVHAWTLARYLTSPMAPFGDPLASGGARGDLVLTATFTVGPLLLVWVAGAIRDHGLGNGYGALLASGVALAVVRMFGFVDVATYAVLLATAILGGALFARALRWRIGGLRAPVTTIVPVQLALVLATLLGLLTLLPLGAPLSRLFDLQGWLGGHVAIGAAIVVGGVGFAYASARPAALAELRAHAGLAPATWAGWARALLFGVLLLALAFVLRLSLVAHVPAGFAAILPIATVPLLGAVALDIAGELRARRAALVKAWPLQHAQHADIVQQHLADAGIPCFLHASHLRALFGPFGAWCPIDVLVAPADLDAARGKIAALYHTENLRAFD